MKAGDALTHSFLGEEFLTWIWFRWEAEGGEFSMTGGRTVGVALDDMLTFASSDDQETEHTLKHGLPTRTPEARTALSSGRRLRKARVLVAEGSRQWQFTFDASTMTTTGMRLPDDDEEATTNEERNLDRVENWLRISQILEELYGVFLRERLQPTFVDAEGKRQAQWMRASVRTTRA